MKNPTVVEEYLVMECELGRAIGQLDPGAFPHYPDKQIQSDPKTPSTQKVATYCGPTLPRKGVVSMMV